MVDVYVEPQQMYGMGMTVYRVFADGVLIDEMVARPWITYRDMIDMGRGYAEALESFENAQEQA